MGASNLRASSYIWINFLKQEAQNVLCFQKRCESVLRRKSVQWLMHIAVGCKLIKYFLSRRAINSIHTINSAAGLLHERDNKK